MMQPNTVLRTPYLGVILGLILLLTASVAAQGDPDCCIGRVGDANGFGGDEPTIGDIVVMIDMKFVFSGSCLDHIPCLQEADINQSGGANPACDDITIGDISKLIDYLFVTGPSMGLPDCIAQSSDPYGYVVDRTDCKLESPPEGTGASMTCILYEYDGAGTLSLTHQNAGLNCCPIPAFEILVEDYTITINESDSGLCDCYCLYDVDYQIENLPPGEYQIAVNEAFNVIGDPLTFTIDLSQSLSGMFCVPRGGYPWSGDVSGVVVDHSGCLSMDFATKSASAPGNQSCVTYEYDGSGVLSMYHANAGFNCCPGDMLVDISLDGNTVTVVETETLDQGGCACLCLFDLDFWVVNLPPGVYDFVFVEPYVDGEMERLEFTLDLTGPTSGEYCVERAEYPWDPMSEAEGTLVSNTGCKGSPTALAEPDATDQSCIEYEYDGAGTLTMTHVNAGFNCCPTAITAEFGLYPWDIFVNEIEDLSEGGCFCLCLYDLEMQVTGVPPGQYQIAFSEPYRASEEPLFRISLDLTGATSGTVCVQRDYYPWGQ